MPRHLRRHSVTENAREGSRGPGAHAWKSVPPRRHAGCLGRELQRLGGVTEKIPYLLDLGVTAVELLPVYQFDPQDAPPDRVNYWGYSPVSFFAPHAGYAATREPLAVLDEFRDMVKALHRAGIEVILDVVYNHTAEGNERGPTFCFRGLDNRAYYILDRNWAYYANYTGTGNTLKASHPMVRRLILDSLRYWVAEMHVDGIRFDLASILTRDESGQPLRNPPIVWEIESDPLLAGTKLIAEAWDAAGLYQVGTWVGDAWKEWNGRFRDDVRSFVKSEPGMVGRLADRLFASPDVYAWEGREADQSVNFVTCHDGFTLNDLVSYNAKHNEANGEGNRDGMDDNRSWNCGVEGPTDDGAVEALRARQVRNLLALTLLSAGVPMIVMGDEARRTQRGNNNAYSHDDELTWLDWSLVERHRDLRRFVRKLVELRLAFDPSAQIGAVSLSEFLERCRISWHGVRLEAPDWSYPSRSLAVGFSTPDGQVRAHCLFNAYWEPLAFELPAVRDGWRRLVDTAPPPPDDARTWGEASVLPEGPYAAAIGGGAGKRREVGVRKRRAGRRRGGQAGRCTHASWTVIAVGKDRAANCSLTQCRRSAGCSCLTRASAYRLWALRVRRSCPTGATACRHRRGGRRTGSRRRR